MKFAFIIMGQFDSERDRAAIGGESAQIVGVSNIEEACDVAKKLYAGGTGCIELCGAFGEAGAKKVIDATGNNVPVGYSVHLPEQDSLYHLAFSDS